MNNEKFIIENHSVIDKYEIIYYLINNIEINHIYNDHENNRLFDVIKYHPENRELIKQSIFDSYYLCNTLLFIAYYILYEEIEDLLEVLSINQLEDDFVSLIRIKKYEKEN